MLTYYPMFLTFKIEKFKKQVCLQFSTGQPFTVEPNFFVWPGNTRTLILINKQGVLVMFEVTDLATQNLKSYMEQNKIDSALRVALMSGG